MKQHADLFLLGIPQEKSTTSIITCNESRFLHCIYTITANNNREKTKTSRINNEPAWNRSPYFHPCCFSSCR